MTVAAGIGTSFTPPAAGAYTVIFTATDSEHAASVATLTLVAVNQPTFTSISAPTVNYGQGALIKVTVGAAGAVPSGTVLLRVDAAQYTGTVIGGVASFDVSALSAGPHALPSTSNIVYTPAQIRTAYGINNLALDGTGQTIAIVDAYSDPAIFQALDAFDTQFGLTDAGPNLYTLYGPAATFLTVLNQQGQGTNLPAVDPTGAGTGNWVMEMALDLEWAHAIAPGAHLRGRVRRRPLPGQRRQSHPDRRRRG
jgi:subtilase family serine protease